MDIWETATDHLHTSSTTLHPSFLHQQIFVKKSADNPLLRFCTITATMVVLQFNSSGIWIAIGDSLSTPCQTKVIIVVSIFDPSTCVTSPFLPFSTMTIVNICFSPLTWILSCFQTLVRINIGPDGPIRL